MIPLNPQTLPDNDNIPGNSYAYCVKLDGQLFMQTGRMIAYYPAPYGPGIRFEPLTSASIGGMVATRFSAPLYTRDWVVAHGSGPGATAKPQPGKNPLRDLSCAGGARIVAASVPEDSWRAEHVIAALPFHRRRARPTW